MTCTHEKLIFGLPVVLLLQLLISCASFMSKNGSHSARPALRRHRLRRSNVESSHAEALAVHRLPKLRAVVTRQRPKSAIGEGCNIWDRTDHSKDNCCWRDMQPTAQLMPVHTAREQEIQLLLLPRRGGYFESTEVKQTLFLCAFKGDSALASQSASASTAVLLRQQPCDCPD